MKSEKLCIPCIMVDDNQSGLMHCLLRLQITETIERGSGGYRITLRWISTNIFCVRSSSQTPYRVLR
jgi:hypothetical protein